MELAPGDQVGGLQPVAADDLAVEPGGHFLVVGKRRGQGFTKGHVDSALVTDDALVDAGEILVGLFPIAAGDLPLV